MAQINFNENKKTSLDKVNKLIGSNKGVFFLYINMFLYALLVTCWILKVFNII